MSKLNGTVLVVDDDEDVLLTAEMILSTKFQQVITLINPELILKTLRDNSVDVIFLDMNFKSGQTSGNEGIFWLREILKNDSKAFVVMQTAYGDINTAVECMKIGSTDFITKPWDKQKLLTTATNTFKLKKSDQEIIKLKKQKDILSMDLMKQFGKLKGNSEGLKRVKDTICKVAPTEASVLILGENGTGKELVARELHLQSERKNEVFVKVDLGTLPESLAESQLFGHIKGAFTDAKEMGTGFFERASGGSLFLDEIGNISASLQSKLLSAIQDSQIIKVGDSTPKKIDIRLICATNKPLYKMVENGEFREDLLYRINTVEIRIPPLRERKSDIGILLEEFFERFKNKYNKYNLKLEKGLEQKLERYGWPGNIRELEHSTERAVILSNEEDLTESDFIRNVPTATTIDFDREDEVNMESVEKQVILKAIVKSEYNLTKSAEILGMGRSTLYRKMKKYNIE